MSTSIQLYQLFKQKLDEIGHVERAWFTTFTLDISFFEKYILAALLRQDPKLLQSATDYEAMNQQLCEDGEESSEEEPKTEVRIFYDFRALGMSGRPKQTTVILHPVDPAELDKNFRYGVFHPKVCLLQSGQRLWLVTGSSNLTLDGWARNRESFFFQEVTDFRIARELGLFFDSILPSKQGLNQNSLIVRLLTGKNFGGNDANWIFHSSFSKKPFIKQLIGNGVANELLVWSPYFERDLSHLLKHEHFQELSQLRIIPARNAQEKIRITEDAINECLTLEDIDVSFLEDVGLKVQQGQHVHAKLWLAPGALAIGSWNFSAAGLNVGLPGRNNIEAGVIHGLSTRTYNRYIQSIETKPLRKPACVTAEELEEDKEELTKDYSLYIDLLADWQSLELKLVLPTVNKIIEKLGNNAVIQVPGMGEIKVQHWDSGISFRKYSKVYLTDRMFAVKDSVGEIKFLGYIRETNTGERPSLQFSNFDDLLQAWISSVPEEKQDWQVFAGGDDLNNGLAAEVYTVLGNNEQNPWLSTFLAFERMVGRIKKAVKENSRKEERIKTLVRLGRVLPGSLTEMRQHLDQLLEFFATNRKDFKKSPVYLWFVVEKANLLFRFYNQQIGLYEEKIQDLRNIDLKRELPSLRKVDPDGYHQWIQFTKRKLRVTV